MQANDETLMEVYNAARLAVEFAGGVNKTAFMVDAKTRSAVLYQLLVLAEAAKRLDETFRGQHTEFPWDTIDAMGSRPGDIDINEAWGVLWEDVPAILNAVESIIPQGSES